MAQVHNIQGQPPQYSGPPQYGGPPQIQPPVTPIYPTGTPLPPQVPQRDNTTLWLTVLIIAWSLPVLTLLIVLLINQLTTGSLMR